MTDTPEVLRLMDEVAARAGVETAPDDDDDGTAAATTASGDATAPAAAPHGPSGGTNEVGSRRSTPSEPPPRSEGAQAAHRHLHEASDWAQAGTRLPAEARLKPVKQALLAMLRPVTSHQVPFNEEMIAAVNGMVAEIERLERDLVLQEQRATRLQAGIATTDITVDDLNDSLKGLTAEVDGQSDGAERLLSTVDDLQRTVDELQSAVNELRSSAGGFAALRSEVATLRAKQSLLFRAAAAAMPGGFDVGQLGALSRELSSDYEELYEDLEDTFRGSRDAVMARQAVYLADIRALTGRAPVVDVGCGRGEWLEVLRDAGIDGYGVDPNEVVVQRCVTRGLDARRADALVHLRDVPEGSVGAVTGFHVVEHLTLDTLVQLVDAALVALKPGGLLIIETPNPTNVNVGAASFYLDPTHLKPLHPQFLEFLVLARGFTEVEVRYLHAEDGARLAPTDLASVADAGRAKELTDRINWSMFGPLDYAIVARKSTPGGGPPA